MTEEIDDSLYSRQRCVLGDVAMRKLSRSKVFLCGLDAVGVEIAKNLVLGGIEELTIQDNARCTVADMGVQFFIRQADVDSGKTRAEASLPHLVALNPYVRVSLETNDVTSIATPLASEVNLQLLKPLWNPDEEKTTRVECLIVTQCSLHAATLLNIFCRKHSIRFIYTNVYGVLGNLFCDFGPQFNVVDPDGEPPKEFFIGHVGKLNSTQLLIKVFGDGRHYLETGNVVQFRALEGMTELNGQVFPVQVISPSELLIYTVTEDLSGYTGGGIACQVIQPQMQSFETLLEQLRKPKITIADLSRPPEEGMLLHLVFLSLMKFQHEERRLPEPWCDSDWNLFSEKFHALNELSPLKIDQPNMEFVRRLARVSQGQLAPLCAFFGGVAAQEAMKALTGSFTPLNQWLYMHCEPVIPSTSVTTRTNTDLHSRYGPLAICIGPENLQRLKNLSAFMVGCGAIGCELLKNLALLGVATGDRAAISQTQPMLDSNTQQTSVRENVDTCGSSGPLHSPLSISQPNQGGAGDVTSGQFTPSCNSSTAQTLGSTSLNHHIPDGSTVLDDRQAGVSVTGITTLIVENDQVRTSRSGVLVDKASETQVANTEPISHHSAVSSTSHLSESHAASAEVCVKRPKADSKEATTSRVRETLAQSTKSFPLSGIETEVHNASGPSSASRANVNVSSLQADSRPLLLITDPDHIEKSNLNRQFLFHAKHIGLSKSAVAAEAARQMNSAMRITSMEEKVWPANEKTLFTDEFLLNLLSPKSHKSAESRVPSGIVLAALDCVPSRRYVDTRCVSLHLPLLESGTLGTKGHVQVILPGLTESYNSQRDDDGGPDAAESIPYCTLKSFPTLPIHCVEWAREKFASQFTLKPERLSQLLTVLDRSRPGRQLSVLCASLLRIPTANSDQLLNEAERETKARWLSGQLTCSLASFLASRPIDWYGCVRLARDKFERYFNHKARQLLHSFPPETRLADGTPFWQLPKRQPTPVEFRATDPLHQKFLMSYSRLLADQLTIAPTAGVDFNSSNAEDLAKHLDSCLQGYTPPVFVPSAKRIATDEDGTFEASVNNQNAEATTGGDPLNLDEHTIRALRTTLTALEDAVKLRSIYACHSVAFEKDDDRLAHVDFIASAANLRAVMYGLPVTPRHEVRRIAGRIVPAIATTTAAIAGLVCLELVKYACRTPTSDSLNPTTHASRNAFLNLALPVIILSEPAPCPRIRLPNQSEFTLWDRWTVEPSKSLDIYTLEDFVLDLKKQHALEATFITQGNRMVYISYLPGHQSRLSKRFTTLLDLDPEDAYVDLSIAYDAGVDAPANADYIHGPPVRFLLRPTRGSVVSS